MLVGFECPNGQKISFKECLQNCTQQKRCLPVPMPVGIVRYALEERPNGYTVTQISQCLRKSYFEIKYNYYANPKEQLFFAYRGNVIHSILSDFDTFRESGVYYNGRFVIEKRFYKPIEIVIGQKKHLLRFSGKIDIYDSHTKTLYDYKTISDFVKQDLLPRPHHVVQTNIYSYLLSPTYKVERIVVVYVAMNNVYEVELEPKQYDDILDFIRKQLAKLHYAVTQNVVPEATPNGFCKMCMFKQKCTEIEKLTKKFSNL